MARLVVELVPESCPRINLSIYLDAEPWRRVEQTLRQRAGGRCELCGHGGADATLDCDVVWSYDDSADVQRLERLLVVCVACGEVLHFDLAALAGTADRALRHLAEVNGWDELTAEQHVAAAYRRWEERSHRVWTSDLTRLSGYGLEPPQPTWAGSTTLRIDPSEGHVDPFTIRSFHAEPRDLNLNDR